MKRVVITGAGTINALGHNVSDTLEAMRDGRCGIGALEFRDVERLAIRIGGQVRGFETEVRFNRQQMTLYDRFTLSGISRFRIREEVEGFTPYRRCNVDWAGFDRDMGKAERDDGFHREKFMNLLSRFFESRGLSTDWESLTEADDELLINSLSMLLDFNPEDKQALLEAPSLATRRETLVTLIEFALRGGDDEELLQ